MDSRAQKNGGRRPEFLLNLTVAERSNVARFHPIRSLTGRQLAKKKGNTTKTSLTGIAVGVMLACSAIAATAPTVPPDGDLIGVRTDLASIVVLHGTDTTTSGPTWMLLFSEVLTAWKPRNSDSS